MNYLIVFIVGGLFCLITQLIMDFTKIPPAKILVFYVVLGAILGALGIYKPLLDFAKMGAAIPLPGFGSSLIKSTFKAVDEDGLLGVFTGGLTGTAGGIEAAIIFGLLMSLLFKSKTKY
ncbi:MAG: stage V sporulation protein AE [Oscillospiraceae bacterium]|nr:stage V sporulation protein AE [Oscillospiraceae bacterium]